jgi:hypothetical protein
VFISTQLVTDRIVQKYIWRHYRYAGVTVMWLEQGRLAQIDGDSAYVVC